MIQIVLLVGLSPTSTLSLSLVLGPWGRAGTEHPLPASRPSTVSVLGFVSWTRGMWLR